jgi:hypothetical protein
MRFVLVVAFLFAISPAHAEVASIYGGRDGLVVTELQAVFRSIARP